MKLSLSIKLTIFVLILFALVITTCLLWRPVKVRYYAAKLNSENIEVRQHAAKILLDLDCEKVFRYYTDRYDPKDVNKRMAVVDELCGNTGEEGQEISGIGQKGKILMKEIFCDRVYSEQVKIPAGTLTLSNGSKVEIRSLWVDKYEVTEKKYFTFCSCRGHHLFIPSLSNADMFNELESPIMQITFPGAEAYANWLGMRLPTIYEWEYAARAGSTSKYCFGDNDSMLDEYAWYKDNYIGKPYPVGQKKPNKWGLYDVHGGVWEMCKNFPQVMGGSFCDDLETCGFIDKAPSFTLPPPAGFRCVRDP